LTLPSATPARLTLASASPRRRELLAATGMEFEVEPSRFDETTVRDLPARRQAVAAARGKADYVHSRRPGDWVIGCDTVVVLDGECLGKPHRPHDAAQMLQRLSGREHSVISAVSVITPDGRRASAAASGRVRVAAISAAQIRAYVATGEPLDKAGAYAIQGGAAEFARLVSGEFDTVVGLPLRLLHRLLRRLGYQGAPSYSDNLDPA
jgi:septum formation protein